MVGHVDLIRHTLRCNPFRPQHDGSPVVWTTYRAYFWGTGFLWNLDRKRTLLLDRWARVRTPSFRTCKPEQGPEMGYQGAEGTTAKTMVCSRLQFGRRARFWRLHRCFWIIVWSCRCRRMLESKVADFDIPNSGSYANVGSSGWRNCLQPLLPGHRHIASDRSRRTFGRYRQWSRLVLCGSTTLVPPERKALILVVT